MTSGERREMDTFSLTQLAAEQLAVARSATNGRSARTLHGRRGTSLRQTVMALAAGNALADHEAPGEATLQVLAGRVRLVTSSASGEGGVGDFLVIPAGRHSLEALEDSAILLTVVVPAQP